ncbi:MAG: SGNH/GDSL hydrolase family protein [Anaerolineales bacterium]|nr:SGNH/GDSL hydrolase family protein [Anaerolineales bacterium]
MINNKRANFYSQILPVLLGGFLGIIMLILYQNQGIDVEFDELALGEATQSLFAKADGVPIHCSVLSDAFSCIDGYLQDNSDLILWLGNSQIHAINQKQESDETATAILHRKFKQSLQYFMAFSQPNASLQEHYILFEYLLERLPVHILVLPIVFDDMRETGIRPELADIFQDSQIASRLSKTNIGRTLLAANGDKDSAGNDMAALNDTVQEQVEKFLNDNLAESSSLWERRPISRGKLFTDLYKFRNWALGINPSSVRRVIPGNYSQNIEAFNAILDTAKTHNVIVLTYIVPLRNDVQPPYNMDEYNTFKAEIASITQSQGVRHVDLENLVPAEYWGVKSSTTADGNNELDFMHFQSSGHQLLAEALYKELISLINEESQK